MNSLAKYGVMAAIIGGLYLFANNSNNSYTEEDIDLNAVLDITIDTIHSYQDGLDKVSQDQLNADQAFLGFTEELGSNLNMAQPAIHTTSIGVAAQEDASILAYEDPNANKQLDDGEALLFKIEIDGENSRVIASSRSGAVNDHHFSGTGLLAGYLIGSMLGRQRMAGVDSKSLASKRPVTAKAAARARAGSGSHSRGK